MIKIAFQLTRQELYQALLTIATSRRSVKISQWMGVLFIVASIVIIAAEFILRAHIPWYALVFLAVSLYITFNLNFLIWYQAQNLVKTNAPITEPMSYTFQEFNYEFTGESFLTRFEYAKLHEVVIGKDFILLKISESSAHIVPIRAFSADQLDLFKATIQSIPNLKLKVS